jgi:hypothetical protein
MRFDKVEKGMFDRVEKVLRAVYHRRGEATPQRLDPHWRAEVLRQIRTLPSETEPPLLWLFQQYIWRLAPVACALIIAMGLWMTQTGLSPELDLVALSLDNSVSVNLIASFGM